MGLKKGANADEIKKAYRKVNTELNIICYNVLALHWEEYICPKSHLPQNFWSDMESRWKGMEVDENG